MAPFTSSLHDGRKNRAHLNFGVVVFVLNKRTNPIPSFMRHYNFPVHNFFKAPPQYSDIGIRYQCEF